MLRATTAGRCAYLALGAWLAACRPADPGLSLLAQAKAGLADRDRRIASYRFEGEVVAADGQRATYRLTFRGPRRLRADLLEPARGTFLVDGDALVTLDAEGRRVSAVDLSSADEAAAADRLHAVIGPLVPEGFRSPLVGRDVAARPGPTVMGRDTVVLTARAQAQGESASVAYLLARRDWDVVGKDVGAASVRVAEEWCDPASRLCFPSVLERRVGGAPESTTRLANIAVNVGLPDEAFRPAPIRTPSPRRARPGRPVRSRRCRR